MEDIIFIIKVREGYNKKIFPIPKRAKESTVRNPKKTASINGIVFLKP